MMKITGLSHLFKWENMHNWWLTKYFFAPLYMHDCMHFTKHNETDHTQDSTHLEMNRRSLSLKQI